MSAWWMSRRLKSSIYSCSHNVGAQVRLASIREATFTNGCSYDRLDGDKLLLFRPIVEFASQNPVDCVDHLSYFKPDMDWPAIQRLLSMFLHFLFHLLTYVALKVFPGTTIGEAGARVALAFYMLLVLALL
jgi:hypothetical protein